MRENESKAVDVEVLVVGAGPTGLVVAGELLRRGIACRLIDSLAQPCDKSRALAIHARTLEVFDMMGVVDEFIKVGWQSRAFTVFASKTPIVRMTFNELDSRFPFLLSMPQTISEQILGDYAANLGARVERGITLRTLVQNEEKVIVKLEHSDGKEEMLSCRWVVGCDGAHSTVRSIINQPFSGEPYWEQYALADVHFETTLDPSDHYLFSGRKRVAGFHAFSPHCARIYAQLGKVPHSNHNGRPQADPPPFPEPSIDELQAILDECGPGSVHLTKLNWLSMHRIHRRQVETYRQNRVFLAGDSAHVHSPTGGQGMNLGIQDAFNLAWKLALVQKNMASAALLDSYSIERHLVGKQVTVMADFFTRINEVRSPILQLLRNTVGPVLSRQPDIRHRYRRAVSGLSRNYRLSPAVDEHVQFTGMRKKLLHETPKAGERAPDVTVFTASKFAPVLLFDLLRGTNMQLLLLAGLLPSAKIDMELRKIRDLVTSQYNELIDIHLIAKDKSDLARLEFDGSQFLDPQFHAHETYGAEHACAYLIRPDGYVGFRSLPPNAAALHAYLGTRFPLTV